VRTSTGRVGLRNAVVREFASSGESRHSRFLECRRRNDYSPPLCTSLFPTLVLGEQVPGGNLIFFPALALGERTWSSLQHPCTTLSGTTTSTKHHLAFGCFRLYAGYVDLILKIAIFVSSVYSMLDVFFSRKITCHVLLFGAGIIFMMMLVTYYLDKHIYDIM